MVILVQQLFLSQQYSAILLNMNYPIEQILIISSLLLLFSVIASKASQTIGVPALLLFLIIGMIAGSEGIGGIAFTDVKITQFVGTVALSFILFAGGLETDWLYVKPIVKDGIMLSTIAVLISTLIVAVATYYILDFSIRESLLLGAIVSSTDAAAVFNILKAHSIFLNNKVKTLIEFESASNDPMAVILTIAIMNSFSITELNYYDLFKDFLLQIILGIIVGYGMGKFTTWFFKYVKLDNLGLYHALTVGVIFFVYSITAIIGGSGFLAVYLTGLILGCEKFSQKQETIHFYEGITWLMQICVFLTLGLLVFPSQLTNQFQLNLLVAFILVLVARPLSVYLTLIKSKFNNKDKITISILGFKGAIPIILATFPLIAHIPKAEVIFNLVFFMVLVSVLVQGILAKKIIETLNRP